MSSIVQVGGIDLSDITALAANVDSGKKFIDSNGDLIIGTSNKVYTAAEYNAYGTARYNAGKPTNVDIVKAQQQSGWVLYCLVVVTVQNGSVSVNMVSSGRNDTISLPGQFHTYELRGCGGHNAYIAIQGDYDYSHRYGLSNTFYS